MKQIFINIPVNDLDKAQQFYIALGFMINPLFTDDQQKCNVWSGTIYIMLQSRAFANMYIHKTAVDPRKNQMPSFTLPVESVALVNNIMDKGLHAGGQEPVPAINEDFMYLRSIQDLDGYIWGLMCLDMDKFKSLKNK